MRFAYLSEFKRLFKLFANFCRQSMRKAWQANLITKCHDADSLRDGN